MKVKQKYWKEPTSSNIWIEVVGCHLLIVFQSLIQIAMKAY